MNQKKNRESVLTQIKNSLRGSMRCPSISNNSVTSRIGGINHYPGRTPSEARNLLNPDSLNSSMISLATTKRINIPDYEKRMNSACFDPIQFASKISQKNIRAKSRERSSSDQFRIISNNREKPLYLKNMEYLIKKAKMSSVSKRFNDVQTNVLQKAKRYSIPKGMYYISKLLDSLLLRNNEFYSKPYIEHFSLTCQSVLYVKELVPPPLDCEELTSRFVNLPEKSDKKKTLIFDLDETLVHCSTEKVEGSDITLLISLKDGKLVKVRKNLLESH